MMRFGRIGRLSEIASTWNPQKSGLAGTFRYIDIGSIDHHTKTISNTSEITYAEAPSRARQLVQAGDVLVSTVRPNLNAVAVVPTELDGATASTGFCVLRPTAELIGRYLFHWVQSPEFVRDMSAQATGQSYPAISDRIVRESRIPLPDSVGEQRAIAAILDQADALLAKRRRASPLLDELAQSIFLDMYRGIHNDDMVALGDYLTFVTSGGRGWAKYYSESGSRFIRSLDVRMNEIEDRSAVYVTPPNNAEARRTRVRSGDVLLTITGSLIGRVAPVSPDLEGSYVSQHVAILRPEASMLDPRFLAFFLSIPSKGQRQIARLQYGQTKPGLNFEQIRKMKIPLPDISQQRLFAERLIAVRRIAESNSAHLDGLEQLADSIRRRAFCGEL